MARGVDLTLHIGLQKTGTSLIQSSLRALAPALRKKDTIYIDVLDMREMKNIRGWTAFLNDEPERHDAFLKEMSDLVAERARALQGRPRHVLVSNEGLVGTHSPNYGRPFRPKAELAINDLITAIGPTETRLVLYIRRQDRLIESAYMQRIHAGQAYSFKKFLSRFEEGPIMDFGALVTRLGAIPTVTEVTTRPFELIGAGPIPFVDDFLAAAATPRIDLSALAGIKQSNPSYTLPAYQAALTINRLVSTRRQQLDVRKFLKHLFPVGDYPNPVLFTDLERKACLDLYAPSNEEFFRRYHPDIPHDVYSTDEATKQLATYLTQ